MQVRAFERYILLSVLIDQLELIGFHFRCI